MDKFNAEVNYHNRFKQLVENEANTTMRNKMLDELDKHDEISQYYALVFKLMQGKLDRSLPVEDRNKLIIEMINHPLFDYVNDYAAYWKYGLANGVLQKGMPLYSSSYFAKGLESFAWYIIDDWKAFEGKTKELIEYTVLSNQALEKGTNSKNEALSVDIAEGTAISSPSPDKQLESRRKLLQAGLDNEELKEQYDLYIALGKQYGFDKSLTPEQKAAAKVIWIDKFKQEHSQYSPEDRYRRLREMFNQIGTDLERMNDVLRKPVQPNRKKQPVLFQSDIQDRVSDFALGSVELSNPIHINGLLTIQKDEKLKTYFPIYMMLADKFEGDEDSVFASIADEMDNLIRQTDLSKMEKEIVRLIMGVDDEFNIYAKGINPYKQLVDHINSKYNTKKTKADIIRLVKSKISTALSNTYIDLENGLDYKECVSCHKEKIASVHNFGKDARNAKGLKSVCKKCDAKNKKIIKEIS